MISVEDKEKVSQGERWNGVGGLTGVGGRLDAAAAGALQR